MHKNKNKLTLLAKILDFITPAAYVTLNLFFIIYNAPLLKFLNLFISVLLIVLLALYIVFIGPFLTFTIHELSHACAIKIFNKKAKIKRYYSLKGPYTACNCWETFTNTQYKIIAIAGFSGKSIIFIILGFALKMICNVNNIAIHKIQYFILAPIALGITQLLPVNNRDGWCFLHPTDREKLRYYR